MAAQLIDAEELASTLAGLHGLEIRDMITFRIHGVDADFIAAMADARAITGM